MQLTLGQGHKDKVASYVLNDFAKAEQGWLDDMMRGISDGAPALARGDNAKFQNAVALRVNPPRNGSTGGDPSKKPKAKPEPKPAAAPEPQAPAEDTRTPLQKLADKFR